MPPPRRPMPTTASELDRDIDQVRVEPRGARIRGGLGPRHGPDARRGDRARPGAGRTTPRRRYGAKRIGVDPRELEIADLVALGLANREIAERLVISPGTVRIHVERILGKLGRTSRVQVATWVSRSETARTAVAHPTRTTSPAKICRPTDARTDRRRLHCRGAGRRRSAGSANRPGISPTEATVFATVRRYAGLAARDPGAHCRTRPGHRRCLRSSRARVNAPDRDPGRRGRRHGRDRRSLSRGERAAVPCLARCPATPFGPVGEARSGWEKWSSTTDTRGRRGSRSAGAARGSDYGRGDSRGIGRVSTNWFLLRARVLVVSLLLAAPLVALGLGSRHPCWPIRSSTRRRCRAMSPFGQPMWLNPPAAVDDEYSRENGDMSNPGDSTYLSLNVPAPGGAEQRRLRQPQGSPGGGPANAASFTLNSNGSFQYVPRGTAISVGIASSTSTTSPAGPAPTAPPLSDEAGDEDPGTGRLLHHGRGCHVERREHRRADCDRLAPSASAAC